MGPIGLISKTKKGFTAMYLLPLVVFSLLTGVESSGEQPVVSFKEHVGKLDILIRDEPFASYVYDDAEIPRPYFCQVMAPGGIPVTRTHPPDRELDRGNDDHEKFHPGVWLAFGDLGGADFWRNKAHVRHARFEQAPEGGTTGIFTVTNVYETLETPPQVLCEETCRYTITASSKARWIVAESRFHAMKPGITFGDQEEMGFGVRLATALTVKHGNGSLVNAFGGVNEEGTWGKQADWCAFSGLVEGHRAGVLLAVSPDNFRKSWFHNRDYGLMVANPFGRKSMTAPKEGSVKLDATPLLEGTTLSLGFAVCAFSNHTEEHPDYKSLYACYLNKMTVE